MGTLHECSTQFNQRVGQVVYKLNTELEKLSRCPYASVYPRSNQSKFSPFNLWPEMCSTVWRTWHLVKHTMYQHYQSFALTKGSRSKCQPTHSLRHSAYPRQPYVDTLYVLPLCQCRPKLVITGTSVPLASDSLLHCAWLWHWLLVGSCGALLAGLLLQMKNIPSTAGCRIQPQPLGPQSFTADSN